MSIEQNRKRIFRVEPITIEKPKRLYKDCLNTCACNLLRKFNLGYGISHVCEASKPKEEMAILNK